MKWGAWTFTSRHVAAYAKTLARLRKRLRILGLEFGGVTFLIVWYRPAVPDPEEFLERITAIPNMDAGLRALEDSPDRDADGKEMK